MIHVGRHYGLNDVRSLSTSALNPADVGGPDLLFSALNQAVAMSAITNANEGVRGTKGYASGLKYFECKSGPSSTNRVQIGLVPSTADLTQSLAQANTVMTTPSGVSVMNNSGAAPAWNSANMAWDNGIILCVAVNATTRKVWVLPLNGLAPGWNNNAGADPASGTGGLTVGGTGAIYPAASLILLTGDSGPKGVSFNFGDIGFTGPVPAGFSPWN